MRLSAPTSKAVRFRGSTGTGWHRSGQISGPAGQRDAWAQHDVPLFDGVRHDRDDWIVHEVEVVPPAGQPARRAGHFEDEGKWPCVAEVEDRRPADDG